MPATYGATDTTESMKDQRAVARLRTPPMGTNTHVNGAVVIALAATLLIYGMVAQFTGNTALRLVLGAILPLAALLPAVWVAASRARVSRASWQAGEDVLARRSAASARSIAVSSIGISVFVAIVAGLLALVFTNDGAVYNTFFNVNLMFKSAWNIVKALWINIQIALGAQIAAMVFGLILALGRLLPGRGFGPVRFLCVAYIDVFRGIPSVILIYLVCYGLPIADVSILSGGPLLIYAIVALGMTYSAYNAELFRAGIESINPAQTQAALSMGLTQADVTRFVILPQALRNVAAPLLSQFIGLQKDTALVIVVGVIDAFSQAKIYSANDFNLSAVTAVAIIFVLITLPQTRLVDWVLARTSTKKAKI